MSGVRIPPPLPDYKMNFLYLTLYLIIVNLLTFIVYYQDKSAARHGRYRISEKFLLTLALVGGSIGAYLGQRILRHKTRKKGFQFVSGVIIIIHIGLAIYISACGYESLVDLIAYPVL